MNGRIYAVLLLVIVGLVCLISVPATSGEHPWDSDINGSDKAVVVNPPGGDQGNADTTVTDTTNGSNPDNQDGSETPPDQSSSQALMYTALQYMMSMVLNF